MKHIDLDKLRIELDRNPLEQFRNFVGITQEQLSEDTGVSIETVRSLELRISFQQCKVGSLLRLAVYYDLSFDDFFDILLQYEEYCKSNPPKLQPFAGVEYECIEHTINKNPTTISLLLINRETEEVKRFSRENFIRSVRNGEISVTNVTVGKNGNLYVNRKVPMKRNW